MFVFLYLYVTIKLIVKKKCILFDIIIKQMTLLFSSQKLNSKKKYLINLEITHDKISNPKIEIIFSYIIYSK